MILALVIFVWLSSAIWWPDDSDLPPGETEGAQLTQVEVTRLVEQSYQPLISVQAKTKANREVDIRAELSGQVLSLPVKRGGLVVTGETICELDPQDRLAANASARAAVARAELEYTGALSLKQKGVQSELAIARSLANLEAAKAHQQKTEYRVKKLRMLAPFSGVIEDRPLEIGDYAQVGQICATILELDPMLIIGQVAATDITKLRLGQRADFIHSEGTVDSALITYLASTTDPITQTFRVEAQIKNSSGILRAGIAGTLAAETRAVRAHLIPASVLLLDDNGDMMVKILSNGNQIQNMTVEQLGVDDNGIWVQGLPERTALITMGQNYVSARENVTPVFAEPAKKLR
jgi:multidrug efflux system membrane fusion protein